MFKQTITTICLIFLFTYCAPKGDAQVVIKTSAVCDMCKKTIEQKMKGIDGIVTASLNVDSKELTVSYVSAKTSPDQIRKAVAETGYDADDVTAVPEAYEKLHDCCKK